MFNLTPCYHDSMLHISNGIWYTKYYHHHQWQWDGQTFYLEAWRWYYTLMQPSGGKYYKSFIWMLYFNFCEIKIEILGTPWGENDGMMNHGCRMLLDTLLLGIFSVIFYKYLTRYPCSKNFHTKKSACLDTCHVWWHSDVSDITHVSSVT